jgi:hypothetical protein
MYVFIKNKTIDIPKIVNILINVSTRFQSSSGIGGRGKTRKWNGTDRRDWNGGTGKAETEKRVKRIKEGKTRKKG